MATTTKEIINKIDLTIHEVEEKAIIVNIQGWRIRAYFDKSLTKAQKEAYTLGRSVTISYTGNIEDVHSVKLLPLK